MMMIVQVIFTFMVFNDHHRRLFQSGSLMKMMIRLILGKLLRVMLSLLKVSENVVAAAASGCCREF